MLQSIAKLHLVEKVETNTHCISLLLLLLFHVEMVEIYIQYSLINNVIFNPKFSNKDTIRLIVRITTEFELRCAKPSIYKEFEQS